MGGVQWEYRVVREEGRSLDASLKHIVALANDYGADGWEMVDYDVQNLLNANPQHFIVSCIFKRPSTGESSIDITEFPIASRRP